MSVVGFDFGSESCRVAVVRRGAVEVLQNEIGNRNTASMVGFSRSQRLLGDAAAPQYKSNYLNTITMAKRVLGQELTDEFAKHEGPFLPYKLFLKNNEPYVEVSYNEAATQLSMVQITAALLGQLKRIAEHGLGQAVRDCVIGVPTCWTEKQKLALLDSAQVAGLNVMQLMHETTAVALNYGILRPLPKDQQMKVLFVDVGHTSTNVALVAFQQGKLQVLATAGDQFLGGRSFDQVLIAHFAKHIQDTYKMDVLSNQKAAMKLKDECFRVKKILSANSTVKFNVEYIMNDKDVSGVIERANYEKMCIPLLERLLVPVNQALSQAGVKKEEVNSIEIVGGATRVPMVRKAFNDYFGKEVSQTCDADESVARGCALMCAILSPSIRVRSFEVTDSIPYDVEVTWGKTKDESAILFKTGTTPLGSTKAVTLPKRSTSFQVTATEVGGLSFQKGLGVWSVTGFPTSTTGASAPKVTVHVKLDANGIVTIPSVMWKELLPIEEKTEEKVEDAKKNEKQEEKKTENQDEKKEEKNDQKEDKKEEKKGEKKDEKKAAKQSREVELTVAEEKPGRLTPQGVQELKAVEVDMAARDALVRETNEARNLVETYVLETRSKLEGDWSQFAPSQVRDDLSRMLMDTEDWVYDGNHSRDDYRGKLKELRSHGDPIERREKEHLRRPEAVGELNRAISEAIAQAESPDPKYAHIKSEEKKKVVQNSKEAQEWVTKELKLQEARTCSEDPVLTVEALEKKRVQVVNYAKSVMNEPPPPPPEKKEEEKPKEEAKAAEPKAEDKKPEEEKPAAEPESAKAEEKKPEPAKKETKASGHTKPAEKKQKKNSSPSKKGKTAPMDTSP